MSIIHIPFIPYDLSEGNRISAAWLNAVQDFIAALSESGGSSLVGFSQPESGAIEETLETKNRQIKNASDYSSFATAIGVVAGHNLVVSSAIVLTGDAEVPSTVQLTIEKGGSITTTGYMLTINGPFSAAPMQVFPGTGSVVFAKSSVEKILVQWYAAADCTGGASPSGTNDSAAIQRAFDTAIASDIAWIDFANANYLFGSKVNINPPAGLKITGAGGMYREGDTTGYPIRGGLYGSSGLSCMFDVGNGSTDIMGGVSFEGVNAFGVNAGTDVVDFVKVTSACSAPQWPIRFYQCHASGFSNGAVTFSSAQNYCAAFLQMDHNAFYQNGYVARSATNRVVGLSFSNNLCQAQISGVISGVFHGPINIGGGGPNNFELTPVPIDLIDAWSKQVFVAPNYFENNTGPLIRAVGDIVSSAVTIDPQYVQSLTGALYDFSGLAVDDRSGAKADTGTTNRVNPVYVQQSTEYSSRRTGTKNQVAAPLVNAYLVPADDALRVPNVNAVATQALATSGASSIPTPWGAKDSKTIATGACSSTSSSIATAATETLVMTWALYFESGTLPTNLVVQVDGGADISANTSVAPQYSNAWYVLVVAFNPSGSIDSTAYDLFPYGLAGSGDGCVIVPGVAYTITQSDNDMVILPYIPRT